MPTPTPEDWESLRPDIQDLYVRQNRTITQIRDILREQNYTVGERAVRTKIELWNFHKNIREREILTALDLLTEAHAQRDGVDRKVAIRGKILGFHEIALRLRNNKGVTDPWQWRRTRSREGFTPSPHVRLVGDTPLAHTERGNRHIHSGSLGPGPDELAGSEDVIRGLEPLPSSLAFGSEVLDPQIPTPRLPTPQLMSTGQDRKMAEGFYHLRDYCWDYLQTKRSTTHFEPVIHQQTVHGQFGDHMQNGLALFTRGQWIPAFWIFDKACALISDLLEDDHPMSLTLLFAVVCELATHNAAVVVSSVLAQALEISKIKAGKSADLQKLLESLLKCPDFAWYACQYARICLDVFESCNPFKWKTLYVKERLCDCLYHCKQFGTGSSTRSSLLLEQENFYGKNARNVLWTLTNVADDRLNAGDHQGALNSFQLAFDRARNIDGFGKAKIQFAAQEGLAKASLAEATSLSWVNQDGQTSLRRQECLRQAICHVDQAIETATIWFHSSSRRISRTLDLKAQIENSDCN